MKIQLYSDLHLEFADFEPPETTADVVVLAGDIDVKGRGVAWAAKHFSVPVIYVAGNHEYFGKAYPKLLHEMQSEAAGTNVHVLERDVMSIDGVNFLGATLWTDFELFGDARLTGYACQQQMRDYKKIRRSPGYSKLRSVDTATLHRQSLEWLGHELQARAGQTNVVVSHHAPSTRSLPAGWQDEECSAAYASNLEHFVEEHAPALWLHGHTHERRDYTIGATRVCVNPRGYPGQKTGFDDGMTCALQ